MQVKILGSGCSKCISLERKLRELIDEHHLDQVELVKVTDLNEMLDYGIMMTPGLVINEQLKSVGRVPSDSQLLTWIQEIN